MAGEKGRSGEDEEEWQGRRAEGGDVSPGACGGIRRAITGRSPGSLWSPGDGPGPRRSARQHRVADGRSVSRFEVSGARREGVTDGVRAKHYGMGEKRMESPQSARDVCGHHRQPSLVARVNGAR